jgi:hypothetical protein
VIQVSEDRYDQLTKLEAAVKRVLSQRGDDICWRDVYTELAALVGVEFTPELIGDREKMMANCKRFVDSMYDGGPYVPVYVEARQPTGLVGFGTACEGKECK